MFLVLDLLEILLQITVCFFVSEWLIPLKYTLYNHFSLYYCLILNGKKEVGISHVSSSSLILVKKLDLFFITMIFSITPLCFFILTLTKIYLDLRKKILPFVSNVEKVLEISFTR